MANSPGTAPRVRVFLTTYRRSALLKRALNSLLAQTLTDWTCELHNDDPIDLFPGQLVEQISDPRITLRQHASNLGAVHTFNLVFGASPPEPFYTLLEDDNAWEPSFLDVMVAALEAHPGTTIAWCNQRVWVETANGDWTDRGALVHPSETTGPRLVPWGKPDQALGALHANGAMLIRSRPDASYAIPATPLASVEAFRERLFAHPMLYVPAPLAVFSVTRTTARQSDGADWTCALVALVATFVRHSPVKGRAVPADLGQEDISSNKGERKGEATAAQGPCAALWAHYSTQQPAPTNILLNAALLEPSCRPFLRLARPGDWVRWLRGAVRHPGHIAAVLRSRSRQAALWAFLDKATAERFRQAGEAPP